MANTRIVINAESAIREMRRAAKKYGDTVINKTRKKTSVLLKEEIVDSLQKGISPVKLRNTRLKGYSKSYLEQIKKGRYKEFSKKQRPVNLTLSGRMLKSIKSRLTKTGMTIFFSNPLAKYHNDQGAGKSKVIRKMLPDENQQVSKEILDNLFALIANLA